MKRRLPRLYLVTNEQVVGAADFCEGASVALAAGGGECALQLRAHGLAGRTFCDLGRTLKRVVAETGSSLWINDRIDLALAVRADGVQLGSRSLSPADARRLLGRRCWIGSSIHSVQEVASAFAAGADLAVLGNIYTTPSHPDRAPLGLERLQEAVKAAAGRPIVAIGGITPDAACDVVKAGAWGVAVLSRIWQSDDLGAQVTQYVQAIKSGLAFRGEPNRKLT